MSFAEADIHQFVASAGWPDPDMSVLRPDRPEAPVMSPEEFRAVFGPWAGWITNSAEAKGAHVDYVALALLVTASAAIGNSRWVVPWSGWEEPPVLWGALVGNPSAGKSPALDAVLDPVREIESELAEEYRDSRADWEAKDEIAKMVLAGWKGEAKTAIADGEAPPEKPDDADAGAAPIRERIRITDATCEKVAELLATTWRGLLLSRDELSGWIASMDRYNGGGDRAFWLEGYGGRAYVIDRKNSPEPIVVDHHTVAVIGGTQPDKLDSLLVKADDDGLLARFLLVYPAATPPVRPTVELDRETPIAALKLLRQLQPAMDQHGNKRPYFVHLTEDAREVLQAFREECQNRESEAVGLYKGHIGKMPGMVLRVANVLAHLDWAFSGDGPGVAAIGEGHVARACHYVGEHLRRHAFRAYGASVLPTERRNARRIAEIIISERLGNISQRDITRRGLSGMEKADQVRKAIAELVDADWLAPIDGKSVGRPRLTFAVNPKLEDMA